MKKNLQTAFSPRQYMLSKNYEIYYYNDNSLPGVEIHSHDYYEFYFFLEGDVSLRLDSSIFPISPGDIMLVPPGLPHQAIIHSQSRPYRRFVFWISQSYCEELSLLSTDYTWLMRQTGQAQGCIFHNDQVVFNGIQARILKLLEELKSERFGKEAQLSLDVNDLLLHLNRVIYERSHRNAPQEKSSLCQNLLLYIEENLDEDLSLDALSDRFYVSKYHIAHIFKENFGLSIHQYIVKKRLALGKEAILSGKNMAETCQLSGFEDYSGFYRAFKKEYGISPKEFHDRKVH